MWHMFSTWLHLYLIFLIKESDFETNLNFFLLNRHNIYNDVAIFVDIPNFISI